MNASLTYFLVASLVLTLALDASHAQNAGVTTRNGNGSQSTATERNGVPAFVPTDNLRLLDLHRLGPTDARRKAEELGDRFSGSERARRSTAPRSRFRRAPSFILRPNPVPRPAP